MRINSFAPNTVSSPFIFSVPFDNNLISGFSTPSIFLEYILPIRANCNKFSGLHRTVAPTSSIKLGLSIVGSGTPRAGLSIPGSLPTTKTPPATIAPVLPAETQP